MKALLALEDGTVMAGRACGAPGEAGGEMVFNTSMTGYQEVLTDPSYKGQIVAMTYPLVGNTGINPEDMDLISVIDDPECVVASIFNYYQSRGFNRLPVEHGGKTQRSVCCGFQRAAGLIEQPKAHFSLGELLQVGRSILQTQGARFRVTQNQVDAAAGQRGDRPKCAPCA